MKPTFKPGASGALTSRCDCHPAGHTHCCQAAKNPIRQNPEGHHAQYCRWQDLHDAGNDRGPRCTGRNCRDPWAELVTEAVFLN